MAAGTFTLYAATLDKWDIADLVAGTVKCALVSSAYTPDYAYNGDDTWSDVSGNEIASGDGYTTGGATLTGDAATGVTGGFKYSSDNISWTASGSGISAWRRAVFYYSGTIGGLTNPLIGSFLGDATPADIPVTASGFTLLLTTPANGWFKITT